MTHSHPHILVIDDHKDTREALVGTLARLGCQAADACDGELALALAAQNSFDVALIGVVTPPPSGLELVRILKQKHPHMAIIMVAAHGSIEDAIGATHHGALYCIAAPSQFEMMLARMCELFAGSIHTPSAVSEAGDPSLAHLQAALESLTDREREVLQVLALGCSDRKIAELLKISFHTARTHVWNIMHKLGVQNRTQAALIARQFEKNTAFA